MMPDFQPYLVYIGVAAIVLLAMLLLVFLFRRSRSGTRGGRGQRLGINEFCEIDETRRLVLVRRDDVEHLILIGGPQDVVIESGIGAVSQLKQPVDAAVVTSVKSSDDVVPFRAAPRAPVFGGKRPSLHAVDDATDGNGPKQA